MVAPQNQKNSRLALRQFVSCAILIKQETIYSIQSHYHMLLQVQLNSQIFEISSRYWKKGHLKLRNNA